MTKDGENVASATRSSQDLVGKIYKTCRYIRLGLRGDDLKAANTIQLFSQMRLCAT